MGSLELFSTCALDQFFVIPEGVVSTRWFSRFQYGVTKLKYYKGQVGDTNDCSCLGEDSNKLKVACHFKVGSTYSVQSWWLPHEKVGRYSGSMKFVSYVIFNLRNFMRKLKDI